MNVVTKFFKNKSAKAGSFYLLGNVLNKAILFLSIPIFTRMLTTTEYGIVDTYLAWVPILALIVGLSLGNSIRTAYMDFKDELDNYISSILFLSFLNFLVMSFIIVTLSYYFLSTVNITLVILCLIQAYMIYIINSMKMKYVVLYEYKKNAMLLAVPNLFIIILSIVFISNLSTEKYMGRIIPYVLILSLIGLSYMIYYFLKGRRFINLKYWKYALTLSLPLIFHGLSLNILSTSDRTMITVFRSASETGIYSLVYNLSMAATVITLAMESVWIPWFNKKLKNGEKKLINRNVKIYIEVGVILVIGVLLVSPEILMIMSTEEYWGGKILFPPIILASFFTFLYSITVILEYYYKSTKIIATNTIISAVVNLVLNFIFIPIYGAVAAAYTTVLAYALSFLIHYRAGRKLDNELYPFKIYLIPLIFVLCAVGITYITMEFMVLRWSIAFIGLTVYVAISYKKRRFRELLNN